MKLQQNLYHNFNFLQSKLMELFRKGLLIVFPSLQPSYLNSKAKEICQMLWNRNDYSSSQLPPILSHLFHQLFKSIVYENTSFLVDYQITEKQTIRIRACPLNCALEQKNIVTSQSQEYILFF